MLREILAITGKPGLFRIVSHSNKMLVVEDLMTKKRFPAHARDKVVSLGEIAMYTDSGDKPLGEILDLVYAKNEGKPIDVKKLVANKALKQEFEAVVPDFDKERVYDNDVKKLFTWYNILIESGMTKFAEEQTEEDGEEKLAEAAEPNDGEEK